MLIKHIIDHLQQLNHLLSNLNQSTTMAISASGLCTLLGLIFIGPLIYLTRYLITKEPLKSDVTKDSDGNENISSRAYIFSLLGYAIGIGNVWRFPYVIATNGGAAAVVAYLICGIFVAWPLFTFELILGQYLRKSFIRSWETIRPRWLSLGWAQFLMLFIIQIYYAVVVSYTFPYIAGSCQEPLPWEDNPEEYWTKSILNKYDDLSDKPPGLGPIQWELALSLFVFWIITFFSIAYGKEILYKITYVIVILPIILMAILVCVSVTQPGAAAGIDFYIGKFEVSQLADLSVWANALGQILFSLSPGVGTAITYSSLVSKKEDVYRASMIVCVSNTLFSFIGGFAMFAIVGHLAERQGLPVEEIATRSGAGLAFVTIAEAMSFFGSFKNVMAVLFYIMILLLGLDSGFASTETLVVAVEEALAARGKHFRARTITLALCVIMFLLGLVLTTRVGNDILTVVDLFIGTIFLLFSCFIESIIGNIDLKWQRLQYALKSATFGSKRFPKGRSIYPNLLWKLDFYVVVPFATGFLFIYETVYEASNPHNGYQNSLIAVGWALLALCFGTVFTTVWKREASHLPPIDKDPRFQEVLAEHTAEEEGEIKMVGDETGGEEESDEDLEAGVGVPDDSQQPVMVDIKI